MPFLYEKFFPLQSVPYMLQYMCNLPKEEKLVLQIIISKNTDHVTRDTHYISWAYESWMGYTCSYLHEMLGVEFTEAISLLHNVNEPAETGTLFPRARITLMPWGDFDEAVFYRHLLDAIRAQNVYVKARSVVFDLRDRCRTEKEYKWYIRKIEAVHEAMEGVSKLRGIEPECWTVLCRDEDTVPHEYRELLKK